ncbi:hypothetical protein [Streptomyces sp. NPDC048057]|uniref:hypothetical protein n=1 Tax=Streptomyces sp. NPDC048057 TaxID=3155628 RepID=UPI0033D8D9C6
MAATPTDADRQRLARLVRERRLKLGWTKTRATEEADVTITTYRRVEQGLSVRDTTYGGIEAAFGWAPGACIAILDGATEAQEAGEVEGGVRIAPAPDVEGGVRTAVHNAFIATMPGEPAGKMSEMSEVVLAELRRLGIVPPREDSSP